MDGCKHSLQSKNKISRSLRKFYANRDNRNWLKKKSKKQAISLRKTWANSPSYRKKHRKALKKAWSDPNGHCRKYILPRWIKAGQLASGKKIKNTSIELALQEALRKANIKFKTHPQMHGVPDIYLPNIKLCVFCDGEYWHSKPKRILRDRQVSRSLKRNGYKVIRFKGKTIRKNTNYCIARIRQFIN